VSAVNAAVSDATKAMQWMHDNAATYGFDANRIGIGGASAGAVTALLQAYNSPAAEVTPKVVLSYLGSMYGSEGSIQPGDAPAFIVAGALDTTVPPDHSNILANQLTTLGIPNTMIMQPGIGHTVDFFKLYDGLPLIQHNIDFLATYLVPEPGALALAVLGLVAVWAAGRSATRRSNETFHSFN
jgi:acetyl esterase/lipase